MFEIYSLKLKANRKFPVHKHNQMGLQVYLEVANNDPRTIIIQSVHVLLDFITCTTYKYMKITICCVCQSRSSLKKSSVV